MHAEPEAIKISVSRDGLRVILESAPDGLDLDVLVDRMLAEFSVLKLANTPGAGELMRRLQPLSRSGIRPPGIVLLEGQAPTPPMDGRIEWAQDFFSSRYAIDEKTGTVDYRRRVDRTTVEEGTLLARVVAPVDGHDGRDVFGKRIAAAKAQKVRLRIGPNVRTEAQGENLLVYAGILGRVHWDGETLGVDRVLHINGSVGIATGSLNYPDALIITGDVQAGFSIRNGSDMEVMGNIEPADIEVGGNLIVRGGITGSKGRRVKVKGELHARFILHAEVEAEGDVMVEKEIVHSIIKTHGAVVMPQGRLVGGQVIALGSVSVGQAGNESGLQTSIFAAEDYCLADEMSIKEKDLLQLEQELKELQTGGLAVFLKKGRGEKGARDGQAAYQARLEMLAASITQLRGEIEHARGNESDSLKPLVVIAGKLHAETILSHGGARLHVFDTMSGPLRATWESGAIKLLSA